MIATSVLGELREKGVTVVYNNPQVASSVHILFICVLPSHLPAVIEEIESYIPKQTLVYCMVNHTTAPKLKRTLKTTNIIIPDYLFNSATANDWNSSKSISQALEDEEIVNKCCPLSPESQGKDLLMKVAIQLFTPHKIYFRRQVFNCYDHF